MKPRVTKLVVCNPRRNALLKEGSKSDRIDARKLAELLRSNLRRPVYHGEHGLRTLKELARSYLTIRKDLERVMNRLKAIYRSWGIPCTGKRVYAPCYRSEWLGKIAEPIIATAILDRLLHHSTTIDIRGESYRLKDRRKAGLVPPREQERAAAFTKAEAVSKKTVPS